MKHRELTSLFFAFFYFISVVYIMVLIQEWSDYRCEYPREFKVRDMGFDLLPQVPLPWLPDVWVNTALGLAVVRLALTGHFCIILKRCLLVLGSVYLLRTVAVALTTYPSPPSVSGQVQYRPENPFMGALLVISGSKETVSDLIFSGHTSVLVLTALFWGYYTRDKALFWLYVLFNVLGVVAIVATRFHNSVDIWLAFIISSSVFWIYHIQISGQCGRCDERSWIYWLDDGRFCAPHIRLHR